MGIEIVVCDGRLCPRVRCDLCDEIIEHAHQGNVVDLERKRTKLLYVHKECDLAERSRDKTWQKRSVPWWPLDHFWTYVADNLGADLGDPMEGTATVFENQAARS